MAVANLESALASAVERFKAPMRALKASATGPASAAPLLLLVTTKAAAALLGAPLDSVRPAGLGKTVHGTVNLVEVPLPTRNVVALLPGSDRKLSGEYVAIGAHSDHIGVRPKPEDHDSLRAYNTEVWRMRGRTTENPALNPAQRLAIRVNMDSLRALAPPRLDSIANGADDDGSGSVAALEIAEAMSARRERPRRSILFVWHTAEELGLLGARWFSDNPTVPRDSIVAQLNMDMIGRGSAEDWSGGGPSFLQLVGSRRLSTELGDLVEAVNSARRDPFTFDYSFDAHGHRENIYCRSDHYMYARYGIPIVFFTTGLHQDYHQLTDEPQYIDYTHMARVAQLVHDVALRVANLDHRVMVNGPKPDPNAACRQ